MQELRLNELASILSSNLGVDQKTGQAFLKAFTEALRTSLLRSTKVTVPHIGTFSGIRYEEMPGKEAKVDLSDDLSSRLNHPAYRVRDILSILAGFVREELLNGKKLVIEEIGSLSLICGRPRAEKKGYGQKALIPADSRLAFIPDRLLLESANFQSVSFAMGEDFKKGLDRVPLCFIHLIFPQNDPFVDTISFYYTQGGWTADISTSIVGAMMEIEPDRTYLTILDMSIPDSDKLVRTLKLTREMNRVPLLTVFSSEDDYEVPKRLTILGDVSIHQPFDLRQLLNMADAQILSGSEAETAGPYTLRFHLPTEPREIEDAIALMSRLLSSSGLHEQGQVAFAAAFREALGNAAKHGNQNEQGKKIMVHYDQDPEKISVTVKDRGEGFDTRKYLKRGTTSAEKETRGKKGGLGITLMQKCTDELEFNDAGNSVTLVKYLKSPGA